MNASRFAVSVAWVLGAALVVSGVLLSASSAARASGSPTAVISNVQAGSVATSSATITWNTDTGANSQVFYGTSASYGSSSTLDVSDVNNHSVALAGLAGGTTYHFMVASDNGSGVATSSDATFTTLGIGAPPTISNIQVAVTSTSTATITWNTDASSTSQVVYGETSAYNASSALDSSQTVSHTSYLGGLVANTTYHFAVESSNAGGMASSSDMTFTTASSTGSGSGSGSGTSSSTPLSLAGIDTNSGTAIADGSYNDGWQWTFHFVVPENETQFGFNLSDFTESGNASATIAAGNHVRYWSAQSSNASSSNSAVTLTSSDQYPSTMLNLTSSTGSGTGDRDIDVVVQVAVPSGTASGTYTANWSAESTTTP